MPVQKCGYSSESNITRLFLPSGPWGASAPCLPARAAIWSVTVQPSRPQTVLAVFVLLCSVVATQTLVTDGSRCLFPTLCNAQVSEVPILEEWMKFIIHNIMGLLLAPGEQPAVETNPKVSLIAVPWLYHGRCSFHVYLNTYSPP